MDGSEKLKILLIGKSKKPRCFRGVKWLPLDYTANKKAWMTGEIFENSMVKLDQKFSSENRKILMIIDNCPAHPPDLQSKLKSIELKFFPPNMTSKLQPLDQGIIENFKCHYRRRILSKTIKDLEKNGSIPKLSLIDAIQEVTKAWERDVTSTTISNCFKKAGFGEHLVWEEEDDLPLAFIKKNENNAVNNNDGDLREQYEAWMLLNRKEFEESNFNDFIHVDAEVFTSDFPTDDDIVENIQSPLEETGSNDDPVVGVVRPSDKDITKAIETLCIYIFIHRRKYSRRTLQEFE
jgi:hypothetical protein